MTTSDKNMKEKNIEKKPVAAEGEAPAAAVQETKSHKHRKKKLKPQQHKEEIGKYKSCHHPTKKPLMAHGAGSSKNIPS